MNASVPTPSVCKAVGTLRHGDRSEILADALTIRLGGTTANRHPLAPSLADERLTAAEIVGALNIQTGTKSAANALMTSDDFGNILQTALRAYISDARSMDVEHRAAVALVEAPDFQSFSLARQTGVALRPVVEGMPIPRVVPTTLDESIQVETYGGMATMSREAVINGEWDILGAAVKSLQRAAMQHERTSLMSAIVANPGLTDATPLFHASRGNTTTASLDAAGLSAVIALLRSQPDGETKLGARAAVLLVDANRELALRTLVEASGLSAQIQVIGDDALTDVVIALPDPTEIPALALAHLASGAQPAIGVAPLRGSTALGCRVLHDYAIGIASPRCARLVIS